LPNQAHEACGVIGLQAPAAGQIGMRFLQHDRFTIVKIDSRPNEMKVCPCFDTRRWKKPARTAKPHDDFTGCLGPAEADFSIAHQRMQIAGLFLADMA